MSALRKYKSKSNVFKYAYLGIMTLMALAMFWFDLSTIDMTILLVISQFPMKDDPHSFLIPIKAIDIIEHKGKAKGTGTLIFKNRDSLLPLGKITIEHADQFIMELKQKKADIQVIPS